MSENFKTPEGIDVRGITSSAFTTDLPALATAALAVRTQFNQGEVEQLLRHLQDVADSARRLHL